jgi:multidrug efflux system membrane fusion protein
MYSLRFLLALSSLLLPGFLIAAEPKPVEVQVVRAVMQQVAEHATFTGRVDAVQRVEVRTKLTAYLEKVNFRDGDEVKKGDLLCQLDARPYKAMLARASALLVQAEAKFKLAEANEKRVAAAAVAKAATQQELNQAAAEVTVARAEVDVARVNRQFAELDLEATRIIAPLNGQIGRLLVDVGNLVQGQNTVLAVIVTNDPVHVYFDVDERALLRLHKAAKDGAKPEAVSIGLAAEREFPHSGKIDFTDNKVNPDSGTIRMRAVVANKEQLLRPGMFARVRLRLGAPAAGLLVPAQAVFLHRGANAVYVVVNNKLELRTVTLGPEIEERRVIRTGLKPDELVVVGRHAALSAGQVVAPEVIAPDAVKPEPKREPERESSAPPSTVFPTGAGITSEARYPGANASVVSDTVRAPIEQQVTGVEGARYLRSRCSNDGSYRLQVAFSSGDDLQIRQVLVQNRVALATPQIPAVVQQMGITVLRSGVGVAAIVIVTASDGKANQAELSHVANTQVKDELARLAGVAAVSVLGGADDGMRIQVDPVKLAAHNLTAVDVNAAIDKAKEAEAFDPQKLETLVVKAVEGRVIHLRDVARIERATTSERNAAAFNGQSVVALVVHGNGEVEAKKIIAAVEKELKDIRERLPKGVDLRLPFAISDSATEAVRLDLAMPQSASSVRMRELRRRAEVIVRETAGVAHTLDLPQNPFDAFDADPCMLVFLMPKGERKKERKEIIDTLRTRLQDIKDMTVRVRDLSSGGAYPIDFALSGPEVEHVRAWAKEVGDRLARKKEFSDAWVSRASTLQRQLYIDIDREVAAKRGVALADVSQLLQIYLGGQALPDFRRTNRTLYLQLTPRGDGVDGLRELKVRNANGEMVPLSVIAAMRETEGPLCLDFLNSRPMVQVTANSTGELEATRKLCETLAEEARKELKLSKEYRLTWLHEPKGKGGWKNLLEKVTP